MIRPPPSPALFPYTTLFRSRPRLASPCPLRPPRTIMPCRKSREAPRLPREDRLPEHNLAALHWMFDHAPDRHRPAARQLPRSEEHTSELQSHVNLVCRLLLE